MTKFFCNFFIVVFLGLLFVSCLHKTKFEKWRHIEISPRDKSQVITVITEGNKRYFIEGQYDKIPNDNYLVLDLSNVDKLGDGFSICWDDSTGYKWKLASTYAALLENKLDTSKYLYYQPIEEHAKKLTVDYKGSNCGNYLIRENRKPWGNLLVEFITDN